MPKVSNTTCVRRDRLAVVTVNFQALGLAAKMAQEDKENPMSMFVLMGQMDALMFSLGQLILDLDGEEKALLAKRGDELVEGLRTNPKEYAKLFFAPKEDDLGL